MIQTGLNSPVTLAVLAGGKSSRMGTPKTSLRLEGLPMLAYLLRKLEWDGPTLLVTAPGREHPEAAELFDRETSDSVEGEGPLRGVLTALENSRTEGVCVLTADMPLIRKPHLTALVYALSVSDTLQGVMTSRGDPDGQQIEPFPLAAKRSLAKFISECLAAGKRSVHSLSSVAGVQVLAPQWGREIWTNLNTPEDIQDFLRTRGSPAE
jgi:molybdopterin-guanine dinucleotide biosynthesis protein A